MHYTKNGQPYLGMFKSIKNQISLITILKSKTDENKFHLWYKTMVLLVHSGLFDADFYDYL